MLAEVRESHRRLWQLAGIPWSRGTNPAADRLLAHPSATNALLGPVLELQPNGNTPTR